MILKALYDYYDRCGNLPAPGTEMKQIGFIIVLSKEGKFLRFEDCRNSDKKTARTFLVVQSLVRSGTIPKANYLYDNSAYVLGYSVDKPQLAPQCFGAFAQKIKSIAEANRNNDDIRAVASFYNKGQEAILEAVANDPMWGDISKNLNKKYSIFSFRIEGDTKIIAEKKNLMPQDSHTEEVDSICLVTGKSCHPVLVTTPTSIPGGRSNGKLVAFQVNSGYDSYGKEQAQNAPISSDAEFKYSTALLRLLDGNSHNKFLIGNRTFVFWASQQSEAGKKAEESLFNLLGFSDADADNPNAKIENVRSVFKAIYTGNLRTDLNDRFYILGMAPNAARIAVVYWSETSLKVFAQKISQHFEDMEIVDTRMDKKPYFGLRDILSAVTFGGKSSDASPNLPEAVAKSIFQCLPYPFALYSACIRRVRAEQALTITRAAIIKAYLNRLENKNDNHKPLGIMLDVNNTNQGYLCGRLFAVLEKIQEEANGISTIRERYIGSASATPGTIFATILKLSSHHSEKLVVGRKVQFEQLKQEITGKLPADGFPAHLDLQDQGRFFVGYYHQRQDFFMKKEDKDN